ncbi:hypothetical protein BDZ89DRAFT_900541, partial [Hymenopellis radicata]
MGIDSQANIHALHRPKRQPGQYLLLEFHKQLRTLCRKLPGARLHLTWTPGHNGIQGNEDVDLVAKNAAEGRSSDPHLLPPLFRKPLPRSAAALKAAYMKTIYTAWDLEWSTCPQFKKFKRVNRSTNARSIHKTIVGLPRPNASIIVRLRTGTAPLNKRLHTIHQSDTDACPRCSQTEDLQHYLFHCP